MPLVGILAFGELLSVLFVGISRAVQGSRSSADFRGTYHLDSVIVLKWIQQPDPVSKVRHVLLPVAVDLFRHGYKFVL